MTMLKPCLWFDGQAKQAAEHYVSIFPRSRITAVVKTPPSVAKHTGQKKGSVLTVEFELDRQPYMALNGGPQFRFTEAISLTVLCKDQKEVDRYWRLLSAGGEEGVCGWLKDRYGLSWQVVPKVLPKMLAEATPKQLERVMTAVMEAKKFDVAKLKRAYAGR